MDRLSKSYFAPNDGHPIDFLTCWICGKKHNDIVELNIWQECDDEDNPENIFIVACKDKQCRKIINDHPRLYIAQQWAGHTPGRFMLAGCSLCKLRQGFKCTNPQTKENGGEGLLVYYKEPLGRGIVCFTNGTAMPLLQVFTKCEGFTP